MSAPIEWIAVDWGTSYLRAWAMDEGGAPMAQAHSAQGMGSLQPDQFEAALLKLITPWLGENAPPVIACGMVGARQGWLEAPYAATPCQPQTAQVRVTARSKALDVYIIGGVKQNQPADVMRGEETQIAGFMQCYADWDGILCLPGTHSKWVHISAGEIVSFQTFMSGEIYALLSTQSVLRHTVGTEEWHPQAFETALADSLSKPEALAARLFALRAEALLHDLLPAAARARLSGLLIGAELAAARPYWLGQDIALIGDAALLQHYAQALATQGITALSTDGDQMTLAGLKSAYQTIIRGTDNA